MKQIVNTLEKIKRDGVIVPNRTGVDSKSITGVVHHYNLDEGFPILTLREQNFKNILAEAIWSIRGDANMSYLDQHGVKIWKPWTDEHSNSIGPMYGVAWRNFNGVDQIWNTVESILSNPYSRRHFVSAWMPDYLPNETVDPINNVRHGRMALAPCTVSFQFIVRELPVNKVRSIPRNNNLLKQVGNIPDDALGLIKGMLTRSIEMHVYQRSQDVLVAGGWNASMYALILYMVGLMTDTHPTSLTQYIADAHVYVNQFDELEETLQREPYPLPHLEINYGKVYDTPESFELDDFRLSGYRSHEKMKIPVSV